MNFDIEQVSEVGRGQGLSSSALLNEYLNEMHGRKSESGASAARSNNGLKDLNQLKNDNPLKGHSNEKNDNSMKLFNDLSIIDGPKELSSGKLLGGLASADSVKTIKESNDFSGAAELAECGSPENTQQVSGEGNKASQAEAGKTKEGQKEQSDESEDCSPEQLPELELNDEPEISETDSADPELEQEEESEDPVHVIPEREGPSCPGDEDKDLFV